MDTPVAACRLTRTVADVFGITTDELTDESSPQTVPGWDSLGHLNLILALESEFQVRLSADDALVMRNIAAIRTRLRQVGAEA